MFRDVFIIEWTLKHAKLSRFLNTFEMAHAANVAWMRSCNVPTGDEYNFWMQSTQMMLATNRVLDRLMAQS